MTPFEGECRVTSPFGARKSPITGVAEQHKGIDIVTTGNWPGAAWKVRECTGGTVLRIASDRWRGNYVDVQTDIGVFQRYQHLHEVYVVVGQAVKQGDAIGMAGKTGDSTGVHLHFEVQKNGVPAEPSAWCDVPNREGSHPGNSRMDAAGGQENARGEDAVAGGASPAGEVLVEVVEVTGDLEQLSACDAEATMPPKGGAATQRWPKGEYVVYGRAPLANTTPALKACRLKGQDGTYGWMPQLEGRWKSSMLPLATVVEKGLLGRQVLLQPKLKEAMISLQLANAGLLAVQNNIAAAMGQMEEDNA